MQIILFIGAIVAVATYLTYMSARWAGSQITKDLSNHLHAGESIVNHERIPEAWLLPYRKRIEAMRQAGKSEQEIESVGLRAQAHCLRELDNLIVYFEKNNLTDGDETRDAVLGAMRSQRDRWERAPWRALLMSVPEQLPEGEAADGGA